MIAAAVCQTYCLDREIALTPYGEWLLEDESEEAGAQDSPELVIEVEWTRGGLDELEIDRRLGIREVWRWRREAISGYELVDDRYEPRPHSVCLPALDLALVCQLADVQPLNEAVRRLRDALRASR